jgi:hypothetical protein
MTPSAILAVAVALRKSLASSPDSAIEEIVMSAVAPVMDPSPSEPAGFALALKEAIASLRQEFDAKLAALARNHRIEVESLRREIRDLRARSRASEARESRTTGNDAPGPFADRSLAPVLDASPSGTSARALGTAQRLASHAPPANSAIARDASNPTRLGFVSIAASGLSSVPGATDEAWSNLENDLAVTQPTS